MLGYQIKSVGHPTTDRPTLKMIVLIIYKSNRMSSFLLLSSFLAHNRQRAEENDETIRDSSFF